MAGPTVLFLCQHNADRSQLGAHFLARAAPGRFVATSAGISSAEQINPSWLRPSPRSASAPPPLIFAP